MTINILGTEYEIIHDKTLAERDCDGECNVWSKKILLLPVDDMLDNLSSNSEKQERYDLVMRHEIIHAFLFESGNDKYDDESLVEFLAIQYFKILDCFQSTKKFELDTSSLSPEELKEYINNLSVSKEKMFADNVVSEFGVGRDKCETNIVEDSTRIVIDSDIKSTNVYVDGKIMDLHGAEKIMFEHSIGSDAEWEVYFR